MTDFHGTGVAVVTPFDSNNQVDHSSLKQLIHHLIAEGIDYLVALGTTAETPTLSPLEQSAVLDTFFDTVGDQVPIVIGAGGNNTQKVSQMVKERSKRYQPAGFLSVCPYYNKPSQSGLFAHFREIALHTEADIILYNVPSRTQINMMDTTTLQLAHEIPNITAIKESSGDIGQCLRILAQKPSNFNLISGDDVFGLPLVAMGAIGVISVLGNALPRQVAHMIQQILEGKVSSSRSSLYSLSPLMQLCFEEGNPTGVKAICEALGLCHSRVRLPMLPASATLRVKIEKELVEHAIPTSSPNSSDQ